MGSRQEMVYLAADVECLRRIPGAYAKPGSPFRSVWRRPLKESAGRCQRGELTYVPPHELSDCWDWIREGLFHVKHRSGGDWIPEDVYFALKTEAAMLYIVDNGFCVLKVEEGFDCRRLHIWIAYSEGGGLDYITALEDIGRKAGCKKLTLASRRNFCRFFRPTLTFYEREIP